MSLIQLNVAGDDGQMLKSAASLTTTGSPPLDKSRRREILMDLAAYLEGVAGGNYNPTTLDLQKDGAAATPSFAGPVGAGSVIATGATLTLSSAVAGQSYNINGVDFLGVTANAAGNQFNIGGTDTISAANLAAAINASTSPAIAGVVTATSALGVVTLKPLLKGGTGNAMTAYDTAGRATGTVTISSGSGSVTITINGIVFTKTWATSDTATAIAFVTSINASINASIQGFVTAFSVAGVVTIVSTSQGLAGNIITLAAGGTGMTASGARLTGGTVAGVQATGTVTIASGSGSITATINGVAVSVTWATSDTATATALAAAIQASASALIRGIVIATSAAGVVTIKAIGVPGVDGNNVTLAASGTGATASGANLSGGQNPPNSLPPQYYAFSGGVNGAANAL